MGAEHGTAPDGAVTVKPSPIISRSSAQIVRMAGAIKLGCARGSSDTASEHLLVPYPVVVHGHRFSGVFGANHKRRADEVIRVLRNALAHGNIIYLDENFRELAGRRMAFMAFLSRYEESDEQRQKSTTYRLVVTAEDDFLRFVQLWAEWVGGLVDDGVVAEAA